MLVKPTVKLVRAHLKKT